MTVLHPWHGVHYGDHAPRTVNAIIEIPQGSRCKYEIDKPSGLLKLDRVIYSSFYYPCNYGFIPRTYGDDKDPLDILVLTVFTCYTAYINGGESNWRNANGRQR